jgi:hypothetical protein
LEIPTPAVGTKILVPGSKYCVTKFDYGAINALRTGDTTPHLCYSGNVAAGSLATAGLAASLPDANWFVPAFSVNSLPSALGSYSTLPATAQQPSPDDLKAWGIPCYPSSSGECSIHKGTPTLPNNGGSTETPLIAAGEPFTPKKYQYWAIKLKPYLETQFSLQNKIYADQLFQIDLNIDVTSFKAYAWAEASVWYQYDSSNPTINGNPTNYQNYFFCKGAGLTVKPILMAITLQLKLRNCYKVLI